VWQLEHWSVHKTACKEVAALKKKKLAEEEEARSKAARLVVTNPPCAFCGKASFETCTNCLATHYCDRACQREHWPVHKVPCKKSPIYKANQELAAMKKKLAEHEEALGVEHQETLVTVNFIGLFLQAQGKLREAEVFLRRALEGRERILGRDHPETLSSVSNLGFLLLDQGKLSLAEPFLRRDLEGCEQTIGRDHPDTITSVSNLGKLLKDQGNLSLAEPFLCRALEGYERTLGRSPVHVRVVSNLGFLLKAMEK
jgi:hypothetical protein